MKEGIPAINPAKREQLAGILSAQDWIRSDNSMPEGEREEISQADQKDLKLRVLGIGSGQADLFKG